MYSPAFRSAMMSRIERSVIPMASAISRPVLVERWLMCARTRKWLVRKDQDPVAMRPPPIEPRRRAGRPRCGHYNMNTESRKKDHESCIILWYEEEELQWHKEPSRSS